jgi:hypothetical protein
MKRSLSVLSVALMLFSCSYNSVDSVKPEESIFTLMSDPNFGKSSVNWLMIHDTNGKLLSSQKFNPNDAVVASSSGTKEGDRINITLMQYRIAQGFGGYTYDLTSYLGIPIHETWSTQLISIPQPEPYLGTFKLTMTGFPTLSRINVSDVYGSDALLTFDGSFNSFTTQLGVYQNTKNFFFSSRDPQGNLSYKFLPNVQTGDNYTIGPADLQPAESSIQVPLTQMNSYTLYVSGVTDTESIATNGYIAHNDYGESPLPANVSIFFPAVFSSFRTSLGLTNANGTYYFQSVGPKPTSVAIPTDQVFKITNRTIQNFQYVGNEDFQRRTSEWEFHNWQHGENPAVTVDVTWTVYSAAGVEQKILELPSNFSSIYPTLQFESLVHTGTTFGLQGAASFDDLINSTFKGQPTPVSQTYYSVKVN